MAKYIRLDDDFNRTTEGITLGSDPEMCFAIPVNRKSAVVSPALLEAEGILTNLDDDPTDTRTPEEKCKHPFYLQTPEYTWQMDGVAMELTYKKPYGSVRELVSVFNKAQGDLRKLISKNPTYKGLPLVLTARPVVPIDLEMYTPYLDDNEKIYQGFIFGCDPDEDAIMPDYVCQTVDVMTHPYRYFGGHIHVGHTDPDIQNVLRDRELIRPFVQLLACTVGVLCTTYSPYPKEETLRAQQYGRPGRFRPQKWGIEYRTPSVSWLSMNMDGLMNLDFAIKSAVYYLLNPKIGRQVIDSYLEPAISCIQTADRSMGGWITHATVAGM